MKRLGIFILWTLMFGIVLSKTIPSKQEKEYSAKMTANEWQIVINCIVSPDDVTPNQKKAAFQKLFPQIQQQLAADTIKKK